MAETAAAPPPHVTLVQLETWEVSWKPGLPKRNIAAREQDACDVLLACWGGNRVDARQAGRKFLYKCCWARMNRASCAPGGTALPVDTAGLVHA